MNHGSVPSRAERFLSYPEYRDWHQILPSFIFGRYPGLWAWGWEAAYSLSNVTEVKKVLCIHSHLCLYGMHRDSFHSYKKCVGGYNTTAFHAVAFTEMFLNTCLSPFPVYWQSWCLNVGESFDILFFSASYMLPWEPVMQTFLQSCCIVVCIANAMMPSKQFNFYIFENRKFSDYLKLCAAFPFVSSIHICLRF